MKKVITYGTFDLFHEGHYNILKRAKALGDYLIVGVTSESRLTLTLTGVLKNYDCLLSPYTAILYAGVQDYRSKAGENRRALLLSERSPEPDSDTISALLDVPGATVREYLNTGR